VTPYSAFVSLDIIPQCWYLLAGLISVLLKSDLAAKQYYFQLVFNQLVKQPNTNRELSRHDVCVFMNCDSNQKNIVSGVLHIWTIYYYVVEFVGVSSLYKFGRYVRLLRFYFVGGYGKFSRIPTITTYVKCTWTNVCSDMCNKSICCNI